MQQLNNEGQHSVSWDIGRRPSSAVCVFTSAHQLCALANAHRGHANVPASYHFASANLEAKGGAVVAAVEYGSIA